jgi:hypothetical protein
LGITVSVLKLLSKSWAHACHTIKTKYGVIVRSYANSQTTPLFGPGQGSTSGPTLRSILFCLIEKNIPNTFSSVRMQAADGSIVIDHKGDAFVDNSQLGCATTPPLADSLDLATPLTQSLQRRLAIANLHKLAQRWERLLFSTGGAINLQKSFWILLTWQWKNGEVKLNTPEQDPAQLHLTAGYNTVAEPIPRISPYDGFRTLGVFISPSSSMSIAKIKLSNIAL